MFIRVTTHTGQGQDGEMAWKMEGWYGRTSRRRRAAAGVSSTKVCLFIRIFPKTAAELE